MHILLLFLFSMLITGCQAGERHGNLTEETIYGEEDLKSGLRIGAELTSQYLPSLAGKRVGVTGNQSSMIGTVHLVDSLISAGIEVVKVYCPEHGFRGEAEAGARVQSGTDPLTGLPVISLYGSNKKPTPADLSGIDIMIFDIQDVGARFYTYISTLHYVMEACAEQKIPVLVLDRPNPNAHYVDGPVLKPAFSSFIGMHPVALVHGMTMAEYALMINGEGWLKNGIKCDLSIVTMTNYYRSTIYKLPVDPSPNLQDMDAIYLYPSVCLLEGTIASVGRGTDYPFRLVGHPKVTTGDTTFIPRSIPGKSENPKFLGQMCHGWKLSGQSADGVPLLDSIDLTWLIRIYNETGAGKDFFTSSFNLLAGTDELKKQIIRGESEHSIRLSWQNDLEQFKAIRGKYLIYADNR